MKTKRKTSKELKNKNKTISILKRKKKVWDFGISIVKFINGKLMKMK